MGMPSGHYCLDLTDKFDRIAARKLAELNNKQSRGMKLYTSLLYPHPPLFPPSTSQANILLILTHIVTHHALIHH